MPRPKRPSELNRRVLRRLGRNELAFYRGYLLGLDSLALAYRYLAPGVQPAVALRYIRDQLVMAAHRERRFTIARLVRINVSQAAAPPISVPTLEAYRSEKDPGGGFYTERDLLALYVKDYPQARQMARRTQRNQRLRERQADALIYLEALLVRDPQLLDPIAAWFEPRVAARLEAARLFHLADLVDWVNERGQRWWVSVPRLGVKGATTVMFWLDRHAEVLEITLSARALTPRRQLDETAMHAELGQSISIVPLERFVLPGELDGSNGANRAPMARNLTGASNDYLAIQAWLAARGASPHTTRAYRKEAERLLLWAILERGAALASLLVDDCVQYRDWLAALGRTPPDQWRWHLPQAAWIAPRNAERLSLAWRPFDGPLSPASQQQARVILQAMFQWLTDQRYLDANPWKGVAKEARPHPDQATTDEADLELLTVNASAIDIRDRALSQSQWDAVLAYVQSQPESLGRARLHFVLTFAYGTGLRAAELVSAVTGALRRYSSADGPSYDMLLVRGKGRKIRSVPMPSPVMTALSDYLVRRKHDSNPYACRQTTRLLAPLSEAALEESADPQRALTLDPTPQKAHRSVTTSWLYKLLKACFAGVALEMVEAGRPDDARKLEAASTHWLRHTCGSHAVEQGVPLNVVQQNFGHASLNTTTIYTTQEVETRFDEMERFMKRRG